MELDFTGLDGLAQRKPQQGTDSTRLVVHAPGLADTTVLETEQEPGIGRLQIETDRRQAAAARSMEVCQEYQRNIKQIGRLQTEIARGLLQGEDIYGLFLKAIDALGLLVHDKSLLSRTRENLIDIYGYGFQEPRPLAMELEAVEARIKRMERALAAVEPNTARNIERALEAHRALAEAIKKRIAT